MEHILFLALLSGIQAQDIWSPQAAIVTGREHESLSYCCKYNKDYTHNVKYWCRGESFLLCRIVVTSSRQESGRTSLRDNRGSQKFCVTIKDLTVQDSGMYRCGISVLGFDNQISVTISIDAAEPVTPSKPSTVNPTTKPAMTITPSPSVGPPETSAVTLESPTTPSLQKNQTGSKRREGTGTLTILGISTGALLLFLCLACIITTVWRRTGSRDELEGKGDSLNSFAEATELHYAEVTVNKRSQPQSDFVTYGNLYFHTIAEDRSPEGSVEYAVIKC